MTAAAGPPVGEVAAAVHSGGECLLQVRLPATDKASDNVAELKRQTMEFMTGFMRQQNMDVEEVVDLMEEVVSDGEGEGAAGGKQKGKQKGEKGKKRKQQESPKT